jgi:hypothetical protein
MAARGTRAAAGRAGNRVSHRHVFGANDRILWPRSAGAWTKPASSRAGTLRWSSERRRVGKGWRAMIYAPHSQSALAESPATLEKSSKQEIVAQARKIVDAQLGAQD